MYPHDRCLAVSILVGIIALNLLISQAFGAQYQINTNTQGESVLDKAIAPGGSHEGQTKQQVLQKNTNDFLRGLKDQQSHQTEEVLTNKIKVATSSAQKSANAELNAGITVPTINPIADQVHNANQTVQIPIVAVNPYPDDFALTYGATGLPPGIRVGFHAVTGAPQLEGTLTTAGTYTVNVQVWNDSFTDLKASEPFIWTVNVP